MGTSLQEKSSNGKQAQAHVHSVNTNTSERKQTLLDHTDGLILCLVGLESARLCGCQMVVNERGGLKPIHYSDHNSHGLWCEYLSCSLRTAFPKQQLMCSGEIFTATFAFKSFNFKTAPPDFTGSWGSQKFRQRKKKIGSKGKEQTPTLLCCC